jgi:lipoprotein-releasing system permease protein
MRFETFVAARYLRAKRKTRFVSLISIISVAGVSVGVCALIVVLSVMTGFDIELKRAIMGNRAHLTVFQSHGGEIQDYETVIAEIEALCPEVVGAGPYVRIEALIKHGNYTSGGMILGVDPEREQHVTNLAKNLTTEGHRTYGRGQLPQEKEIVLGYRLANELGYLDVDDNVEIITAKSTVRVFMGKRDGQRLLLYVSGIFDSTMSEFDSRFGFVDLATARMLSGRTGVDGVNLKLDDPDLADEIQDRIEDNLPYLADTWYANNQAFMAALQQEKLVMFVILSFIVLVAVFNITSTLIMVVMEKRRDIGILRTLGASGSSILMIFVMEGLMIGVSGALVGLIGGVLLAMNLNAVAEFIAGLFGVNLFDSVIYYFDSIPVAIKPWDVAVITGSAVVLTLLSTLYPAWSAARLNPVDALRHE